MRMRKGTHVPQGKWGRHRRLLENPDVRRWYDNLARGSPVTADVRLRRLGVYCEIANTTPEEFAGAGAPPSRQLGLPRSFQDLRATPSRRGKGSACDHFA